MTVLVSPQVCDFHLERGRERGGGRDWGRDNNTKDCDYVVFPTFGLSRVFSNYCFLNVFLPRQSSTSKRTSNNIISFHWERPGLLHLNWRVWRIAALADGFTEAAITDNILRHISLISASLHRTEVVACQLQPTVRINSGDRNAIFSLSRHFCRRLRYHWNRITRLPGRLGILPFEYQTICGKKYRFESVFYIFIFDWNVCQKLCCCKAVVSSPDVLGNLPV